MEVKQDMILEEQKQVAIDYYVNLMRIKAAQTSENKELSFGKTKGVKLPLFFIDRWWGLQCVINNLNM